MDRSERRGELLISNQRTRIDARAVHAFLQRSHWAANRQLETVIKSIEHSHCFGVYLDARQVAFSRVVTDYCTFAYLCDVFVDEEFRGRGISKWMMEFVMSEPALQGLRRFLLATKDAHGLYAKYGFAPLTGDEQGRFMGIRNDAV